ncbi:tetratricopeptide repeat protein [Tellurirhabdus rosea]|uniref:tetratricopeptide repeat protein n=1 Tax=Tellurirhabdus rosea TaxID=2674997 RepID=UPI0022587661|nr:tetratricopeptide repeat protein [Tellurirhabdus rosea]
MNRFLPLWMLLLCGSILAEAQPARNTRQAIQFIKLANTLRELDKTPEAIDLLVRALPTVRSSDLYWSAVGYELLGLAYKDQADSARSVYYLTIARSRYEKLRFVASAWAVNELVRDISGKNYYAGIQIGSSQVKLVIAKTRYETDFYDKDIKLQAEFPNSYFLASANPSAGAVPDPIRICLDSIQRYQIPPERVFIALSSDVRNSLAASPARRKQLHSQLTKLLPAGNFRLDTTLSPVREAELFTFGAVPRKVWSSTSALHLGNEVTSGGYFADRRKFQPVNVPFGIQSLVTAIDPRKSMNRDEFRREAQRIVQAVADTALVRRLGGADAGLRQRRTVGLGGDIPRAVVTCLHPERAGTTAVVITPEEVERFKKLALTDYQALLKPDLKGVRDASVRARAERDLAALRDQLGEKQLIAGALWLEAVMKSYAGGPAAKRFVFIRNSDVGWVTGKFLETISGEYEAAIAQGDLYTR